MAMRVAIIGLGDIARKAYLPLLTTREGIEVLLCSHTPATVECVQAQYHLPRGTTDLDELLSWEPQVAFVLTPSPTHRAIAGRMLEAGVEVIDASGRDIVPGFIDVHFYGCGGHSLADLDSIPQELAAISSLLPRWGTTSYLISVPVSDQPSLVRFLEATAEAIAVQEAGAQPLGIHLEGPYLDPERRGAFPPELLREPNVDEMEDYLRAAKGYIRIVTLAPNLPHSRSVARRLRKASVLASLGHSDASYEEAASALSEDFPLVTHVFNAMSGLHHRRPGVVGAILTSERSIGMLICDGIHVHPAAVKLLFRMLGPHRLILVTDAMPGAGLGDRVYRLLGQEVTVKEGKATLPDGTIAGSVLTMDRAVANVQAFTGCSLTDALKMATLNPAEALGLAHRKGRLAPGYDADVVLLDEALQPTLTIVEGEQVFQREGA